MTEEIFDSSYVGDKSTEGSKSESEVKKFLKSPIDEEQMKNYGTSKPKRIIIKANISGS